MNFSIQDLIDKFELNDCKVNSVSLNIGNFSIEIKLEDGYFFKDKFSDQPDILNNGTIKVCNYTSFEARYFDKDTKLWHSLDYTDLDIITEINEKRYQEDVLILSGFGKTTGHWIEYLIDSGKATIEFDK